VPNPSSETLFRRCFPSVGGAPPTPGLQGNSAFGLWLSQGLSLCPAAPETPDSLPHTGCLASEIRRKPLPRKNRLTMPPAQTGSAIYQVPLSRTLIFSASGLYGFYSSAFPESLLLARKSLSENFRLWLPGSAAAVRLLKIPLWGGIFKTHFSYRQREQGLPAAAEF